MLQPTAVAGTAPALERGPGLRLAVDTSAHDPEWDAFVAATPGGHHAQTSLWAQVKAVLGWDGARLIVRQDDDIVGGAQLLTRPVGRFGRVGFAPRGPLLARDDARLLEEVHDALMAFARERRVRYLKVQPPAGGHDVATALEELGWAPSAMEAAPTADVRVDLAQSPEEILARMRPRVRNYVRQATRRDLVIRAGGESDLAAYYNVIEATSRRQGFSPYPARYYETMWRVFGEHARLLLAELDGRVLCATLLVGYGQSATYKMGGWTGERTRVHPSEAIHYAGMLWARDAGYRFYDFDGIHKSIALAAARDGELPEDARQGVAGFKLQFGGDVVLFPGALDASPSRLLRPAVRLAAPRLDRVLSVAHRALGRGS
jgi:peptidoglycan pentaglycine glycine transferase (the first glycine)